MSFKVGDIVRSVQVGVRHPFVGVVVFAAWNWHEKSNFGAVYYHVLDEHGLVWHRSPGELRYVQAAEQAAFKRRQAVSCGAADAAAQHHADDQAAARTGS